MKPAYGFTVLVEYGFHGLNTSNQLCSVENIMIVFRTPGELPMIILIIAAGTIILIFLRNIRVLGAKRIRRNL